ncbi:checkpoint protein HUS1 isoform X2 [Strongylocentrotus purpuratus]|uniref:Checkpoint protein n=1 Tax=Strongylocentrotus purpuratus TaxID=7668 RepID=A0A7M7MZ55_STRPU|nr:checkpoint protein HUS1 isoform X2 [Strongylocentrotus purpuratus]
MRFRAKIFDVGTIEQFTRVVGTIAKLTQLCVLRITSDRMYFILNDKVSKGHLWCDLQALNLFSEFSMEGIAEDANEIYMEVNPDDLLRALKTAQTAKSVKIKLTKKFSPCLSLDVELPSRTGHSRTITHDIPVIVMPRRQWEEYSEPTLPDFDELSANQSGEMRLRVESEQVTVSTHFRNLENPDLDNADSQNSQRDPTDLVGARVDIRKFIHFLSGQQLNPAKIICSIVDNRVMHFFLLHEDLSIQYSMPIIFT